MRVFVLTGGASGIGKALSERILQRSTENQLVFGDVDVPSGQRLEKEWRDRHGRGRVSFVQCDVRTQLPDLLETAWKLYQRVDCLINNAGISEQAGRLEDDRGRLYERVLAVNLTAVVEATRLGVHYIRRLSPRQRNGHHDDGNNDDGQQHPQAGGVIVNVASMSALVPLGVAPVYSASKAGVLAFTLAMAPRLRKQYGIRMHAICPYFVETPLVQKGMEQDPRFAAVVQRQGSFLPMETLLTGFEQLLFPENDNHTGDDHQNNNHNTTTPPTVLTATPQLGLQPWKPKASL